MQQDGYANSTINAHMSAANGLLRYLHRSDLAADMLDWTAAPSPEITRGEYLRLLQTARLMDNPRDYLLVKLLANTDIQLRDLAAVTVENVATGHIPLAGNAPSLVYLPAVLRQELLEYARSQAIKSGPIFVGRGGKPVNRAVVTWVIQQLAEKARVAPEKATPRALHKLYRPLPTASAVTWKYRLGRFMTTCWMPNKKRSGGKTDNKFAFLPRRMATICRAGSSSAGWSQKSSLHGSAASFWFVMTSGQPDLL